MSSKTASIDSTTTLVTTPAKLLGIHIKASSSAGTLTLKDGGSGGTTRVTIKTAAVAGNHFIPFEGGINFGADIYATMSSVDSITGIYQDI
jgi:hypothetical protein